MHASAIDDVERRRARIRRARIFSACSAVSALIVVTGTTLGVAAQPPAPSAAGAPAAPGLPDAAAGRSGGDRARQGALRRQLPVLPRRRHARRRRRAEPAALVGRARRSERRADRRRSSGTAGPGMPKFTLTDAQIADIAAFLHTLPGGRLRRVARQAAQHRRRRREGGRGVLQRRSARRAIRRPATCAASRAKIADPRLLQQTWLMPGTGGGRGGTAAGARAADHRHGDAAVRREGRRRARAHRRLRGRR